MFFSLVYFTILQLACALSIEQSRGSSDYMQARSTHLQKRGMATGAKVALGICIPIAVFTVGLGVFIFMMYPAQLRKLRQQNPGAHVGFAELMTGNVTRQPAPPKYSAQHASATNEPSSETTKPPSYEMQPGFESHTAPAAKEEARHAALAS